MPPAPLELALPDGLDLTRLLGADPGRPRVEDRIFEDTFDGRLRAGKPAGNRALIPLARVRSRIEPYAVRNADGKTVLRLEVERARVGNTTLAPRLRLLPVLGYDKEFARVRRRLAQLPECEATLFDEAVRAAGRDPHGVSSKVGLKLAPGVSAGTAATAVLERLADICEVNVPGTVDDIDSEFLHDLRVAVRRARSVLREFRHVFAPEPWAELREELKWVQAVTGPVRDLDVQLLEWEGGPNLQPLHDLLAAQRARELRKLRRVLAGKRFAAALERWRALEAGGPDAARPVEELAGRRIRSVYRRMVRDGSQITDASPDEDLHDLRKRGKELRYLLELFGGLFPDEVVKPMVAALKGLQDVLGRFQDRAVQADQLRSLGPELAKVEGGPAALMEVGLAVEALLSDQAAARADFAARFAVFASGEQRALVKETF